MGCIRPPFIIHLPAHGKVPKLQRKQPGNNIVVMVHLGLAEDDGPSSEAAAEENSKSSNEKQTLKNDNDLVNTNDSNTNNSTTTTTTTSTQIQQQQQQQQLIIPKEDPKSIPNDETAFTNTPHFSIKNPFHRSLRDLDLSYRCTICYQLYNVPVSLYPCLHSFCSLCIRTNLRSQYTGMKRKAECPLCHVNLLTNGNGGGGGGGGYEKSILQNKALENMVDLYKDRVRGTLRESLVRLDVLEWKEKKGALMMGSGNSMMMAADNNADADPKQQLEEQKEEPSLQSASKRARRSTANYQREYSNESSDNDDDEKDDDEEATYSDATATPAVASASAAAAAATTASFNHLTQQHQYHQSSSPRKRKPTVSYHGLKRKKLIELCQREGLGINGTDQDLKQRHADFIMLYNAQCDSQHPMSENEVAQEIMKQEKCRKRESIEAIQNGSSNHSTYMKRLADNMSSGSGKVTTGSKMVDEEMGNSFKSMIAIIKAKKNGETVDTSMPSCIRSAMVAENDHFESKPSARIATATTMTTTAAGGSTSVAAVAPSKPKSDFPRATPSKKSMRSTSSSSSAAVATTTRATSKPPPKKTTSSTSSAKKSSTKNSTTTTSGMWICQACTFENNKFIAANALCEMCNTRRPEKENTMNEVIAIDC
jgi:E3 ubiquitin-protein ligase RAD18